MPNLTAKVCPSYGSHLWETLGGLTLAVRLGIVVLRYVHHIYLVNITARDDDQLLFSVILVAYHFSGCCGSKNTVKSSS